MVKQKNMNIGDYIDHFEYSKDDVFVSAMIGGEEYTGLLTPKER